MRSSVAVTGPYSPQPFPTTRRNPVVPRGSMMLGLSPPGLSESRLEQWLPLVIRPVRVNLTPSDDGLAPLFREDAVMHFWCLS